MEIFLPRKKADRFVSDVVLVPERVAFVDFVATFFGRRHREFKPGSENCPQFSTNSRFATESHSDEIYGSIEDLFGCRERSIIKNVRLPFRVISSV